MMAKKKKYVPQKDDDWDVEADREHRRIVGEKEKAIKAKYQRWWDQDKGTWKKGFKGHGSS